VDVILPTEGKKRNWGRSEKVDRGFNRKGREGSHVNARSAFVDAREMTGGRTSIDSASGDAMQKPKE